MGGGCSCGKAHVLAGRAVVPSPRRPEPKNNAGSTVGGGIAVADAVCGVASSPNVDGDGAAAESAGCRVSPKARPLLPVPRQGTCLSAWAKESGSRGFAASTVAAGGRPYEELADIATGANALDFVPKKVAATILLDVPRTYFAERRLAACELAALERLLRSVATMDPELAYCQGMNFVSAFALVASTLYPGGAGNRGLVSSSSSGKPAHRGPGGGVVADPFARGGGTTDASASQISESDVDEAEAFWLVVCLLQVYDARGLFKDGTPVLKLYGYCLSCLIEMHLPETHQLLEGLDKVLAFKWFGTLFTTLLPVEVVTFVWDVIIRDGLVSLLCLALGLCSLISPELAAAQSRGEDAAETIGNLQRRLPVDPSILLAPSASDSRPPELPVQRPETEPAAGSVHASVASAAGERLVATAAGFKCSDEELQPLLDTWRRERPQDAADLGASFSWRLHRGASARS